MMRNESGTIPERSAVDDYSPAMSVGEESSIRTLLHQEKSGTKFMIASEEKLIELAEFEGNETQIITGNSNIPRSPSAMSSRRQDTSIFEEIFCGCVERSRWRKVRPCYLITTLIASSLIFVFLQEVVYSKLTTGHATVSLSDNSLLGPPAQVIFNMGALDTNLIRQGQISRLFWSFWLHTGLLHLAINVLSQIALGVILETRWVVWRYIILYYIGGLVGNLASAVLDPCSISAGSSACFFALLAGVIVMLLENWKHTNWQFFYVISICLATLLGISLSFMSNTDNWAHIGGFTAGFLWSLASIETIPHSNIWRDNRRNHHGNNHSHQRNTRHNITQSDVETGRNSPILPANASSIHTRNDDHYSLSTSISNHSKWSRSFLYRRFVPIKCECGGAIQTIRVVAFLTLILIVTFGFLFLLYEPIYSRFNIALGHLSFFGIQACSCCMAPEGQYWCSGAPSWIKKCNQTSFI
ncbi:rhomboid family protein [Cryptosporidium muris RN66]|uniref:Rhomboid-like protease n=1 Tax=Cryptosporidium muris (strain RN66) TaxID=441375 RepID=B6ABU2_CRYMR|nr:rhomboid family protein [Cryptosporidium muris RN66]EEA05295.1 rhomboid family protein [Cryptosporidium muris RN66]|eukprot:XP_002139644.1 rhomboid family protein [Cryptosporidium muris RN66]